ncbi:MAG TPA: cytochrome c [Anaeromyxobacteraceae bacterium]|nr:cytochrome c [Anaeromyxobacteraceae bacterium]
MVRPLVALLALAAALPGLAVDGAAVYSKACASCHGGDGKGNTGPAIAGKPAALVAEVVDMHAPTMKVPKLSAAEASAVGKYVANLK